MREKNAIQSLTPYIPTQNRPAIKLDANESNAYLFDSTITFDNMAIHLYPDSNAKALRRAIASFHGLDADNIVVGNGSSEMIDLMIKTFVEPSEVVLSMAPTFSMYEKFSVTNGATFNSVALDDNYDLNVRDFISHAKEVNATLIILCSPNNPTGKLIPRADILKVARETDAIVLVDEAYMDFSDEASSVKHAVAKYDNLVVTRTFSKAFAMAGARLGFMVLPDALKPSVMKVKPPYNLNSFTQAAGLQALKDPSWFHAHKESMIKRRRALDGALREMGFTVIESDANFLYVICNDETLGEKLLAYDIAIRAFDTTPASYRITVGTSEENQQLIKALKEVLS